MFIHTITYFNNLFLYRQTISSLNRLEVASINKPVRDPRTTTSTKGGPGEWITTYLHAMGHTKILIAFVIYLECFPDIWILVLSKKRTPMILSRIPLQYIFTALFHRPLFRIRLFGSPNRLFGSPKWNPDSPSRPDSIGSFERVQSKIQGIFLTHFL